MLDKSEKKVKELFNEIAGNYDEMNNVISLGTQKKWRSQSLKMVSLSNKTNILDIATGTADVAIELAENTNKKAKIIGLDFSTSMLKIGQRKVDALGSQISKKIELVQGNALKLPFDNDSFDLVTISFGLRNMPNYKKVLLEIFRVLKKDGYIVILEMSKVDNPIIRPFWKLYMNMALPYFGKKSGHKEAYSYLNESAQKFLTKLELKRLLENVGFNSESILIKTYNLGAVATHVARK
ncbi:MAG: bifunctional demethylmenaquinone methyltransferase/2-methoxy-6-polyprenyl-1,4-benzoquinol methylase UbiE [Lactobacillaceae bacterium]|jgi:demethylmenaquinone methyltransferase/2-methoxy-6-polyprenyl-1,4-benzoquinol methylase|nr:bifunctional demethylmenaquinone methyltransferase/2-methoxy-6-polyprenyl-1,4-benzoquinol methylase UbiE [Lactobacillaceae bacterium]